MVLHSQRWSLASASQAKSPSLQSDGPYVLLKALFVLLGPPRAILAGRIVLTALLVILASLLGTFLLLLARECGSAGRRAVSLGAEIPSASREAELIKRTYGRWWARRVS
jgi:hypothetical protein